VELVAAAIASGLFGVIVALVQRGRKENKRDHGNVMDRLDLISGEIRKDIRQVRSDLSDHVNGPAHGAPTIPSKTPAKLRAKRPKAG